LEKEIIDSFAAQVRLPATVVLMRDIIQKASDTDKSITLALRRSVWLSYLLSIGAISAGGLSIFSVSAILGTKPAQANMKEQAVSLPAQTVEEESAFQTSSRSSEHTYPTGFHQDLANREPSPTAEGDFQTKADITGSRHTADSSKIKISEASEALTLKADAPYVTTTALSELQDLGIKDKVEPQVSRIASFSPNRDLVTSSLSIPTQPLQDSAGLLSVKAKPAPTVEIFSKNVENSLDSVEPLQASSPPLKGRALARARLTGLKPVSPNLLFGGTVDLTTGEGFSDTAGTGLDITELYVTASLPSYPNLRFTAGILDLTSYFDRNSFAKDSLTHFFNPVFQTNPALARTGLGSRPAALLNWDISDTLNARAAAFSSSRSLGELAVDGFAGELAYRFDNGIIRATYASDRDDQRNGFEEIYGLARGNGELGPRTSDRESSYGINAEYYIPEIKMGLFGRYGHYQNTSMDRGGDTYSAGFNFLDLFMKDDRLGFGYGRDLSSSSLRRANKAKLPDVWEVFYDFRLTSYLRAGVTLQARDEFSDLVAGFRVKTEFDLLNLGRAFK
jgi:hypothetical protein